MSEAAQQFPDEQEFAEMAKAEVMTKHRRLLWKLHKEDGVTLQTIANESGISRSYLSQYLKGEVVLSDAKLDMLEEYFKKIKYWDNEGFFEETKPQGFISKVEELPFLITECLIRTTYVLEATWTNKNFGMVTGPSGCGKTAAVKYWLDSKPDMADKSIFITANGNMTRKSILRRIAKELGMFFPADADALIEQICAELKAEPRLIIIDEADQISHELKLETLRSVVDGASGCVGIVLIGNEDLAERIMRMAVDKRKLSRIHNRFGANQKVRMPSDAEANELIKHVNLSKIARYKLVAIIRKTNGMGGYRVCHSILKTMFLSVNNQQITEEHLMSESLHKAVLSLNA